MLGWITEGWITDDHLCVHKLLLWHSKSFVLSSRQLVFYATTQMRVGLEGGIIKQAKALLEGCTIAGITAWFGNVIVRVGTGCLGMSCLRKSCLGMSCHIKAIGDWLT